MEIILFLFKYIVRLHGKASVFFVKVVFFVSKEVILILRLKSSWQRCYISYLCFLLLLLLAMIWNYSWIFLNFLKLLENVLRLKGGVWSCYVALVYFEDHVSFLCRGVSFFLILKIMFQPFLYISLSFNRLDFCIFLYHSIGLITCS